MSFNSSYEDQIPEYTHQVNIRIGMLTGEEELCFEKTKVKKVSSAISSLWTKYKVSQQFRFFNYQSPIFFIFPNASFSAISLLTWWKYYRSLPTPTRKRLPLQEEKSHAFSADHHCWHSCFNFRHGRYSIIMIFDIFHHYFIKLYSIMIIICIVMINLIFLPGQMIWEILSRRWFAGWIFCKLFKFCQTFSLASSNYMLITLAIDRHRAVTKPLTVSGSPCR